MKQTVIIPTVVLAALAVGCVSKSTYEDTQAQLATCKEEKAQIDAQVIAWEQRFDRESSRWEGMEASISDALPKALAEFSDERDRILEMVPEQVQTEVASYLEDYFATVMTGFEKIMDSSQSVQLQLQATQATLESLGVDTMSISASIDGALAQERAKRQEDRDRREEVSTRLAGIVAQLAEFDRTQINCKNCPDRLRLNRKERERISAFHSDLMSSLSELQSFAGR